LGDENHGETVSPVPSGREHRAATLCGRGRSSLETTLTGTVQVDLISDFFQLLAMEYESWLSRVESFQ